MAKISTKWQCNCTYENDVFNLTSVADSGVSYTVITDYFLFKANKTYTISFKQSGKFFQKKMFIDGSTVYDNVTDIGTNALKFTPTADVNLALGVYVEVGNGNTLSVWDIQIEENDYPTMFQEFNANDEVKMISKNNNMVDVSYGRVGNNSFTVGQNKDEHYILLNGTNLKADRYIIEKYRKFEKGKTYTVKFHQISGSYTQNNQDWLLLFYPFNTKSLKVNITKFNKCYTFTVDEVYETPPMFWFGVMTGSIAHTYFDNFVLKVQVVEGAYTDETMPTLFDMGDETQYEDIIVLNQPLRSLPDGTRDYVDKENNEVVRKVGEVLLDGSQEMTIITIGINSYKEFGFTVGNVKRNDDNGSIFNVYCDKLKANSRSKTWHANEGIAWGSSGNYYRDMVIFTNETKNMTLDEFKVWIANNPIRVQYPLATPVREPIQLPPVPLINGTMTLEATDGYMETETELTLKKGHSSPWYSNSVSDNPNNTSTIESYEYVRYTASLENTAFAITYNKETQIIHFGSGEGIFDRDPDAINSVFQEKLNNAFGENTVLVNVSEASSRGYDISFYCDDEAKAPMIVNKLSDDKLSELNATDMLVLLNIHDGANNIFDDTTTIATFVGTSTTEMIFTVNDYSASIPTTTTMADFFAMINNSGITAEYSFAKDAFILTNPSGAIYIKDSIGLFSAMGFVEKE